MLGLHLQLLDERDNTRDGVSVRRAPGELLVATSCVASTSSLSMSETTPAMGCTWTPGCRAPGAARARGPSPHPSDWSTKSKNMLRAHRHLIMRRVLIMKERSLSLPPPDPLQFMILFGFCSAEHAISTTSTYTIHFALVPSRLSRLIRSTLYSNVPSRASFWQN